MIKNILQSSVRKRKRITDAVIKEFMERPNEKVSINRIIKPLKFPEAVFTSILTTR